MNKEKTEELKKELWLKYLSLRKRYKDLTPQEKAEWCSYFTIFNSTYGAFGKTI